MEFVKLAISPTKRYYYKDASSIEMNILGEFLITDVGYRHLPFEAWAQDHNAKNASGTLTALEKEENYIILRDIYPKDKKYTSLKIRQEQFLQLLADWQEKVCLTQPQSVTINYNSYEFIIETDNELVTKETPEDRITLFPLIPHTYPLFIKCGSLLCFTLFLKCLLQFPYYFGLSKEVKKAHQEFNSQNYTLAGSLFAQLCNKLPQNEYFKRYLAQSLFKSEDFDDHIQALQILSNIELKKKEWNELLNYMPAEYAEYFQNVKKDKR